MVGCRRRHCAAGTRDRAARHADAARRIVQEDGFRWFERITPTRFEQQHSHRNQRFVGFAAAPRHLDPSRTTFLGYSNGANFVSSLMLLHPGLVERAALLRPMPVLDDAPATGLSGVRVLIVAGAADLTYAPFAPALVTMLSQHGADLDARIVPSGHEFGSADAAIVRHAPKAVPVPAAE